MISKASKATWQETINSQARLLWHKLINHQWFLLLIVVVLIALITGSVNNRFFFSENLLNILEQISVLGLVASGATILIISGNFDISVGAIIGLAACVMAILMLNGVNEAAASVAGILICILCSTANGLLSIVFRAPSFIVSLATLGLW